MASPNPDTESTSMFMAKTPDTMEKQSSPPHSQRLRRSSVTSVTQKADPAEISIKDFFDFMKTAYQVYEHLECDDDSESNKINWDGLMKMTILNHVIDHQEKELLTKTLTAEVKPGLSKSETVLHSVASDSDKSEKRFSCGEIEGISEARRTLALRRHTMRKNTNMELVGVWTEATLKTKLNDVINEGILDSILPYMVGHKKPTKTTSAHQPVIKKLSTHTGTGGDDIKNNRSFGGFLNERESKDRLGRRKSSIANALEKSNQKQDGDIEIHVCDEVKGVKKDFLCPQKLLVSKMGYFAHVTSGQRLEDMDISVHCDIQIFDWLMRWVKRDTILVADWPFLDPMNVVPILVSASFLQMEPLLHDCLIYCHAHMNEILKTTTNMACLSDSLLTRLAAMYTNSELEAIKDKKDKIASRLYCKMIVSLCEPVPETLRGHYATLSTLFKCTKCNKLLSRNVAEKVLCQPSNMRINSRGTVISMHTRDLTWNLNDYIGWLHGELRCWRRVYWRLWADCHFLICTVCDSFFPAYQMDWCCYHAEPAQYFTLEGRPPLPVGRYPCCGERAYRFELLHRNTGCQFREHLPEQEEARDAAVMALFTQFRDAIVMRPPHLMFPERLTRLVAREPDENSGRLQCKDTFWWEGIQLAPPRQPLGLLGKLYTGNTKFNPDMEPGVAVGVAVSSISLAPNYSSVSLQPACAASSPPRGPKTKPLKSDSEPTAAVADQLGSDHGDGPYSKSCSDSDSEESATTSSSSSSASSEEERPLRRRKPLRPVVKRTPTPKNRSGRRARGSGRVWLAALSARSNQDGQRRFEERAARHMRAALSRRHAPTSPSPRSPTRHVAPIPAQHKRSTKTPPGGVYVRLEAEWRESQPVSSGMPGPATRTRLTLSAKQPRPKLFKN